MQNYTIELQGLETAKVLAAVASTFGSLSVKSELWGELANLLRAPTYYPVGEKSLEQVCNDIVADPSGPDAATWDGFSDIEEPEVCWAWFLTPGGVRITITPTRVELDYGRDSAWQHARVLAALVEPVGTRVLPDLIVACEARLDE